MEGAYMYRVLASVSGAHQGAIYTELAEAEERHAEHWLGRLHELGEKPPPFRPGRRARFVSWVARRFGPRAVLPLLQAFESRAQSVSEAPVEMEADERTHARVLQQLGSGATGQSISRREHWHRRAAGGSLRAGVFGVIDGLVSNLSLVMGVSGATSNRHFVLLAGVAGLLAGSFSMAAGEYGSMRAQREVFEREIALEAEELAELPEEEAKELALIYRAKGIPAAEAEALAQRITQEPSTALDTLVREELGLNPEELGSPPAAAVSSFITFALGAFVPVIVFLFASGTAAVVTAAALSALALYLVGALLTLITGRGALRAGLRMLLIGAASASVTFLIGKAIGVSAT
jgi:vacuolar iron transporter family protein